jgi:hypothetical protein
MFRDLKKIFWIGAVLKRQGSLEMAGQSWKYTGVWYSGSRHRKDIYQRIFISYPISKNLWDEDPTKYLQSKCFIQTVINNTSKFNSMLRNSNRQEIGRLVQYITGHCTLNYHANKQNSLLDPQCRRCGSAPETPIHLTRSCESLTESRINLFEGLDILNDGFNWSCGQLLEFLTKSGIWAQLDYLAV